MDTSIIYSKTAKGMAEITNRAGSLPKDQLKALSLVDGQSSVAELSQLLSGDVSLEKLIKDLEQLKLLGLVRIFQQSTQSIASEQKGEVRRNADNSMEFSSSLPMLHAVELSPQESVQAWAEAKRGAQKLATDGFYTHDGKNSTSTRSTSLLTVLVVEDDDLIAELLEAHLTNKSFRVRRAADIPAALAILKNEISLDLVLLDVVLPGMDDKNGFDILDEIRGTPTLRDLPVIMITSQVSDEEVMCGLKGGADGYIFKPFKWETVYKCIKAVISIQEN